ncbi:MAG TPA: DUF488 domain-containing protein [Dongiaceae bacterium]|nr:DUF488 domain-containing protein [Dongiaceae bacterium]
MKLFTIGFTRTSAEHFFARLQAAGVKTVIDVRLNNVSQLAGFAKKDDLRYFARAICGAGYVHLPELAPTPEMLKAYRAGKDGWAAYARAFRGLMARRRVERLDRAPFDGGCLLCSEAAPHHCHRRLVAEYLREKWGDVEIEHL